MQVTSGGTGISGGDELQWLKLGKLVYISCAVWDFKILNPTDNSLILSVPFKNIVVRVVGTMGYNNSGLNIIPVISGGYNTLSFAIKNVNGSTTDLKGNQLPSGGCTLQFNLIYITE